MNRKCEKKNKHLLAAQFSLLSLGQFTSALPFVVRWHAVCAAAPTYQYLYRSLLRVNFGFQTHTALLCPPPCFSRAVCCDSSSAFWLLQGQEQKSSRLRGFMCVFTYKSLRSKEENLKTNEKYYLIINSFLLLSEKLSLKYRAGEEK